MESIFKDGVMYEEYTFQNEGEFENIIFSQSQLIFGNSALVFSKNKIKTQTDIGAIPDGFIIDILNEKFYILEIELSSHDVYSHIIPQITKFRSAFDHIETKKVLAKRFEKEILSDPLKKAIYNINTNKDIYRFLHELFDREPELLIIIEKNHPELNNTLNKIPFKTRLKTFRTFVRCKNCLCDNIYLFEPFINGSSIKGQTKYFQKDLSSNSIENNDIQDTHRNEAHPQKNIVEIYEFDSIINNRTNNSKIKDVTRLFKDWIMGINNDVREKPCKTMVSYYHNKRMFAGLAPGAVQLLIYLKQHEYNDTSKIITNQIGGFGGYVEIKFHYSQINDSYLSKIKDLIIEAYKI